jgi:hypothetical protein
MRKLHILLAAFSAVALMFPVSSHCATVTTNIVSTAGDTGGVDVYGPIASPQPPTPPTPDATQWGTTPVDAAKLDSVDPSWPDPAAPDSTLSGAIWITSPTALDSTKPFTMFSDGLKISLPCTRYNLKGTIYTTANNSEDVYVNDEPAGSAKIADASGLSSGIPFTPVSGDNTFDFVVQTGADSAPGPIALIYKAVISYDVPDVLWRPPIAKSNRTLLKDGTTLPIKFVLNKGKKAIKTVQNIYVAVTGTTDGEVARFDIGQGSTGLRFAKGNGQYITNFKTKDYTLIAGQNYIISVNDGCTGDVLGSVTIQIQAKKPHGKH